MKTLHIKILLAVIIVSLLGTFIIGIIITANTAEKTLCEKDQPTVIAFFEVGTDEEIIKDFESEMKKALDQECFEFTSESEAYLEYYDHLKNSDENETLLEALENQDVKKLPSSFSIYSDRKPNLILGEVRGLKLLMRFRHKIEASDIRIEDASR